MQQKGDAATFKSREVIALIGKHDLKKRNEPQSASRMVERIILHHGWKFDSPKYDSDIALLVLNYPVEFSTFVQPVCLTLDPGMQNIEEGRVVRLNRS